MQEKSEDVKMIDSGRMSEDDENQDEADEKRRAEQAQIKD